MSRGAWLLAGIALGMVALLVWGMGRALDTKAPVRPSRPTPGPDAEAATPSPEEAARREEALMRAIVEGKASALAARAAAQAFPADETAGARCAATGVALVHKDAESAYWRIDYACTNAARPEALPNPTSVSVHLVRGEGGWAVAP